jgi:type I restriction enzyme S subunit
MTKNIQNLIEKHFETAFSAPEGVKKLRELILTLAMQGKLVPQNPNDPPASELLQQIHTEKQKLIKQGKIKKQKPLPPISPDEVPYELPEGWEWVRLGEIGTVNPRNDAPDDLDAGFVPMTFIQSEHGSIHQFEKKKWKSIKKGYTHFGNDDVALAKITPCFENGKSCVMRGLPNGIGAGTTELHIFRNSFNSVSPFFLLYYLKNPRYLESGKLQMTGSAGQKRIPRSFFSEYPFPLPPLAEQRRIVAKIDQLMARCDEIEKLHKEQEAKQQAVHASAIHHLLEAKDKKSFNTSWTFVTHHFDTLYAHPENIAELRKTILQLAVMGKLVPQDPSDQPASELLKQIQSEKQKLIKQGKIKKQKLLPPISPDEVPYELPEGWVWVRLGCLTIKMGSGSTPRGGKRAYTSSGIPFLRSQNVYDNGLQVKSVAFIPEETHQRMANTKVMPKDILLNITGASLGRCALVTDNFPEANVSQHVTIIRLLKSDFRYFMHLVLRSSYGQKLIWGRQVGMAREGLSKKVLELFEIPLPPLAEQHRIVKRVDQLMALCDELKNQTQAATDKQSALLNALMASISQ